MLIGMRIISILFDLFLASVLFYRPISKSKHSKEILLVLCCFLLFHVADDNINKQIAEVKNA